MTKTRKEIAIVGLIILLIIAMIGVSYAVFRFMGAGTKLNTITTGYITMSYEETDNTISLNGALPTTDNTGVRRLNDGEYFDFTVTTNIKGNSYIYYEISAKAQEGNTMDSNYIKLYLSRVNEDGTETSVTDGVSVSSSSVIGTVPTYKEEVMANNNTDRPAGEMSLLTGTISTQGEVTTKYRLRMYVSEDYNPQGDGGGKTFNVKVNVYGKNESMTGPVLKTYNDEPARTDGVNMPQTDFHADEYKKNITSIVTKGDTLIPEGVIESWDMSVADDGSVIAYVEDDGTGSGTYKLTIGGNGKIIANPDMSFYFYNFNKLTNIDLSYLDTSIVTNMGKLFWACSSLPTIDLSGFDTSNVTNMYGMFSGCSGLTELDLSSFDTSKVTNIYMIFSQCSSLTELDLSSFDTSNVTTMSYMFFLCSSLTELDLSYLDTSNVIDMSYMFSRCSSLTELDLSTFDTSNVTDMTHMFFDCSGLTELDLSSFDTSNVTDMPYMFAGNQYSETPYMSLTKIIFGENFNTSNVTDMTSMFSHCSNLTELDLSSFDTSSVTTMASMFSETTKLTTVMVDRNKWSINSSTNTSGMFRNSGVSDVTYA